MLIFISLFERRVEVLADQQVDLKAPQGFWDNVVSAVTSQIKNKGLVGSILEGVNLVHENLDGKFPPRKEKIF